MPTRSVTNVFALSLLYGLLAEPWALGVTRYVRIDSPSPAKPFDTWNNAAHEIQTAVNAAADGDIVLVTNGVYRAGAFVSTNYGISRVGITNGVTLQSVNGPEFTSIEGDNVSPARCVFLSHSNAALIGFTLTNGCTANWPESLRHGGGALIQDMRLMSNCVALSCRTTPYGTGGGAFLSGGQGKLTHCIFRENQAFKGGGLSSFGRGSAEAAHCAIISNNATWCGGGLEIDNSTWIHDFLIYGNSAASMGGGVVLWNSSEIYNCTIEDNQAVEGGDGIYIAYNYVRIHNSIFSHNGNENLRASTIRPADRQIEYCCSTPLTSDLYYAKSCITNAPGYVNRAGCDYRLSSNSPCIDRGFNEEWMMGNARDMDGHARIMNRRIDLGAYEYSKPDETLVPRTYYVATNGNDSASGLSISQPFRTVQHGLDAAKPGDTIFVRQGTYRELLVTPNSGSATNYIALHGYTNEKPVIKGSALVTNWVRHSGAIWKATNWYSFSQQVFDDGAYLQQIGQLPPALSEWICEPVGLGLEDMYPGSFYYSTNELALYVWLADNSAPSNSVIEASYGYDKRLFVSGSYYHIKDLSFRHNGMVTTWGCVVLGPFSILESCDVEWCSMIGLDVGHDAQVIGCNVSHNGYMGIGNGHSNILIRGCTIFSNNYRCFNVDWAAAGMKLMHTTSGIIESNEVAWNFANGIWFDYRRTTNHTEIRSNFVHDNRPPPRDPYDVIAGILVEMSKNIDVHNNLVLNNDGAGIIIAESDNCTVMNNTLVGTKRFEGLCSRTGKRLVEDTGYNSNDSDIGQWATFSSNVVCNNLFYNNAIDMNWTTNSTATPPYRMGNRSDYNSFYRDDGPIRVNGYTTLADYSLASGYDTHSITSHPILLCPPAGNYRLAPLSPCIDQGTNVNWLSSVSDFAGGDRVWNAAVDLGSYEYKAVTGIQIPSITITSRTGRVPYDITTVSGINNANITGTMWAVIWVTNSVSTVSVTRLDAYTWRANTTFGVNLTNVVSVFGGNASGVATSTAAISRGGIGSGKPFVDITNQPPFFAAGTSFVLGGTNNPHVQPGMAWSHFYNGVIVSSGLFTASAEAWTLEIKGLRPGWNPVTVFGTNAWGEASSNTIAIEQGNTPCHYVAADAPAPRYPFTNWATATRRIQDAVAAAGEGDTVWVTNGLYTAGYGTISTVGNSRVVIDKGVTVRSMGGPQYTAIVGLNVGDPLEMRCVFMNHSNAALIGFTLTNGNTAVQPNAARDGGGALIYNLRLMSNCVVRSCRTSPYGTGGGILLMSTNGTLTDCTIQDNLAARGAGLSIHALCGTEAKNCVIVSNHATWCGGGLDVDNSWRVNNCLVAGNQADSMGGGILFWNNAVINNCTVEGNQAEERGDGVYFGGNGSSLYGSIVYSNGEENIYAGPMDNSDRRVEYCCTVPAPSGVVSYHILTNAPSYVDRAAGNFQLAYGSPCIDTLSDCMTSNDLLGVIRPTDGDNDGVARCDMGCYEYDPRTTDSDADRLPDELERRYGLNVTNRSDATEDMDGDGMDNLSEFIAGTDPINQDSFFWAFLAAEAGAGNIISWPSVAGRVYDVYRATNFFSTAWTAMQTDIPATTPMNTWTDYAPVAVGISYYRIKVRKSR
jgi:parallel beta-helix repeat protein